MTTATTSYDEVPYDDLAFAQTHPDHLAATARLFGLQPPPVGTCRVLELGCASGANLIPMAAYLPGSTFVGVDLSGRQIERGLDTVRALGLTNITLRPASVLDIDVEWGRFDYIICHGVFSWVEAEVQDAILRVVRQNLSSEGVAYVSYNTYPGWHMREVVRHMMRYHTAQFEEPSEQVEQARALLAFLLSASGGTGAYGELLAREAERLTHASDSYIFHEHLEQTNTPLYFHQFMERAERAGLLYLSEASVSDMLVSHFPPDVAETLDRISPDILHLEQYMDFVRNRLFRQTLLVHREQRPQRALSPARLHGLMVSCRADTKPGSLDLADGRIVVFVSGQQHAAVPHPASKAAYAILGEEWPHAVGVSDLCNRALERAAPFLPATSIGQARRTLLSDLFEGVTHGLISLHTQQLPCANRPSETPQAHAIVAYQAHRGDIVVNAHHQMVQLDEATARVLQLADGRRTVGDILAVLDAQKNGTPDPVTGGDRGGFNASVGRNDADARATVAALARSALFVR